MPDLRFGTRGAAEALAKLRGVTREAKHGKEAWKENETAARSLERSAVAAMRSTETEAEKLRKKIEAIRQAQAQGLVDDKKSGQAIGRIQDKLTELEEHGDEKAKSLGNHFGGALVRKLGLAVAAFASVQRAISLVSGEVRSQLELIDRANATQQTVAASRNELIRNTAGLPIAARRQIVQQNARLVEETGVSERFINQARAQALSASDTNVAASLDATRISALYNRGGNESAIGGYAGSLLDISRATGSEDALVNFGLFSAIGSASRVTDPRAQAATIPRALNNARAFGLGPLQGAALYTTLTGASGDLTGDTTTNAIIRFAEQLSEFEKLDRFGEDGGTRLRGLLSDSSLTEEFFEGLSIEASAKGALKSLLLDPQSQARRAYEEALGALPTSYEAMRRRGQYELQALEQGNELFGVQETSRGLGTVVEQMRLRDQQALGAEDRANLQEILQRAGRSKLGAQGRTLLQQLDDGGRVTRQEAADILEAEADRIGQVRRETYGGYNVGGEVVITPSDEQKAFAKLMDQAVKTLRSIDDETKKNTRAVEKSGLRGSNN